MARSIRFIQHYTLFGIPYVPGAVAVTDDAVADRLIEQFYAVDSADPNPTPTVPDPLPQYVTSDELEVRLQDFTPSGGTVPIDGVTGLQDALDGKAEASQVDALVKVMPYGTTEAEVAALGLPAGSVVVVPDNPPATNVLGSSGSIETDADFATYNFSTGTGSMNRVANDATAKYGTSFIRFTSTGTANIRVNTITVPCAPGEVISAAVWIRKSTGAAGNLLRCLVSFMDANGANLSAQFSTIPTINATSDWQQVVSAGKSYADAAVTQVRIQAYAEAPAAGDVFDFDGFQLERSDTLPPYNPLP